MASVAQAQDRFCSECKYAQMLEFDDGWKIRCTRPKALAVLNAPYARRVFMTFRSPKSYACPHFEPNGR